MFFVITNDNVMRDLFVEFSSDSYEDCERFTHQRELEFPDNPVDSYETLGPDSFQILSDLEIQDKVASGEWEEIQPFKHYRMQ